MCYHIFLKFLILLKKNSENNYHGTKLGTELARQKLKIYL